MRIMTISVLAQTYVYSNLHSLFKLNEPNTNVIFHDPKEIIKYTYIYNIYNSDFFHLNHNIYNN